MAREIPFGERIGMVRAREQLQRTDMDDELRNVLWNTLAVELGSRNMITEFAVRVAHDVVKESIGALPSDSRGHARWLNSEFFVGRWFKVYEIIELAADCCSAPNFFQIPGKPHFADFRKEVNRILEREFSGFRFIGARLVPITEPEELQAIADAKQATSGSAYSGARTHIDQAVAFLAEKPRGNHRASVKESISAVESVVRVISGANSLKAGLSYLEKKGMVIHPALREGLNSIYGYTGDADGIRHAIIEDSNVDFEDAKFMLVACSAFVHFFISKAGNFSPTVRART